jgi:hypothetical protein
VSRPDRPYGRACSACSRGLHEAIRARAIDAGNHAKDTQRKLDRELDAFIAAAVLGPDLRAGAE